MVGRKTKLNEDLQKEFCNYLRLGGYIGSAAAMVGIDHDTVNGWIKRGAREQIAREDHEELLQKEAEGKKPTKREKDKRAERADIRRRQRRKEAPFVSFKEDVAKAMAQAELADLGVITKSARGEHTIETRTYLDDKGRKVTLEKKAKPEWQASAWRLERRNPRHWGRVTRVDVGGVDDGPPVKVSLVEAAKKAYLENKDRKKKSEDRRSRSNRDEEQP